MEHRARIDPDRDRARRAVAIALRGAREGRDVGRDDGERRRGRSRSSRSHCSSRGPRARRGSGRSRWSPAGRARRRRAGGPCAACTSEERLRHGALDGAVAARDVDRHLVGDRGLRHGRRRVVGAEQAEEIEGARRIGAGERRGGRRQGGDQRQTSSAPVGFANPVDSTRTPLFLTRPDRTGPMAIHERDRAAGQSRTRSERLPKAGPRPEGAARR